MKQEQLEREETKHGPRYGTNYKSVFRGGVQLRTGRGTDYIKDKNGTILRASTVERYVLNAGSSW